jgi:ankyrin repeat protein
MSSEETADEQGMLLTAEALISHLPAHVAHRYVEMPNLNGDTPLFAAIRRGRARIVSLLVDAGADPTRRDNSGQTCLHLVASAEDKGDALEMARALLEHSRADIAETLVAEILHSEIPGRGKSIFPYTTVFLWINGLQQLYRIETD